MQKCDSMRNAVCMNLKRVACVIWKCSGGGLSQNKTEPKCVTIGYLLESVHHLRCFPQLGSLGVVGVETQRFFQVVLGFIHLSDAQKGVASVTQTNVTKQMTCDVCDV
jgi:hypothetical protein